MIVCGGKDLTQKQAAARAKREAAKAERKNLAEQQKSSRELVSKATKVITSAEPMLGKLEKAWDALQKDKNKDNIDEMTIQNVKERIVWTKAAVNDAQKIMKQVSSGKVVDKDEFSDLYGCEIGPEVKSCNSVLKALTYARKAAKPQKGGA